MLSKVISVNDFRFFPFAVIVSCLMQIYPICAENVNLLRLKNRKIINIESQLDEFDY